MDFYFVVQDADGREFREHDVAWDGVPSPLSSLALMSKDGVVFVGLRTSPTCRSFFFCNEAVAFKGGQGILSAKLLGYVDPEGVVHEWRLDLLTDDQVPQLTRRQYPLSDFEFGEASMRTAAT